MLKCTRYVNEPDMTLSTTARSFEAIDGRNWIVPFWQLEAYWVGIAFPFGFILFVLFYFDHNVSVGIMHSVQPRWLTNSH